MGYLPGVYIAKTKKGEVYYRSSITYRSKHISLGSYETEQLAHGAYIAAGQLLNTPSVKITDYKKSFSILSHDKFICLLNFRDNGIYIKTPIYLKKRYFEYYLSKSIILKFDVDDLFYYSTHTIMQRGGHLFISDYGMQINLVSRYGIKNYSVLNKDYYFVNGDEWDYRYGNISIINSYHGVSKIYKNGIPSYITRIIINGSNIVGRYATEIEAAIAYNKAAEILWSKGSKRQYLLNYIVELNEIEYANIYHRLRISKRIRSYEPD